MPVYCVSVVFLLSVDCRLPMKVGPCRAAFPRFFYNPTNQSCSSFVYGGCESNRNNFLTLEECESSCSGVTGEMAELQVGPCRAAFRRWYYDREAGSCQSFTYGGCKGNKNNYVDEESCMVTCSGKYCTCGNTVLVCTCTGETLWICPAGGAGTNTGPVNDPSKCSVSGHCLVSPDPGPCRAAFPMFYYNPDSASCQSFIYGGCRGNENRYGSVEECMDHCSGDGKLFTSQDEAFRLQVCWFHEMNSELLFFSFRSL
uniref:BPTI/Kunitz inhibitor domain-containing protein n=1 Tax=Amphiprion ocellaris TaxID=80972 RepID=A0A3Q1C0Y9_AMPOC